MDKLFGDVLRSSNWSLVIFRFFMHTLPNIVLDTGKEINSLICLHHMNTMWGTHAWPWTPSHSFLLSPCPQAQLWNHFYLAFGEHVLKKVYLRVTNFQEPNGLLNGWADALVCPNDAWDWEFHALDEESPFLMNTKLPSEGKRSLLPHHPNLALMP